MQKSKILNIILAVVILVLLIMNKDSKTPADSIKALFNESQPVDTGKTAHTKRSLGERNLVFPEPAMVIVSYNKEGIPNIMTAAWFGVANSRPFKVSVSLRPATYSYHNIMESKSFTVNVPDASLVPYVKFAGTYSGRDMNKFEETGLTPVKSEFVNAPYVKEFPIVIECELTEYHDLGSHRQFIGKVVDVKADKAILNANDRVNVNLLNPLIYGGGKYYETGRFIAKVGESIDQIDGRPFVPNYSDRYANDALEVIHSRKSVRHFTDQPVSKDQIETLLRAGMAAPTAANRQPWVFYVVTEREVLDSLGEQLPYAKMLLQAQKAIVVCGDMEKAGNLADKGYWVQDCSAASENILLAAESIGLGAVWTASYPYDDRTKAVIKTLNLPQNHVPLNVIPVGYPTGVDKPKDKWKPENIFWE